MPDNPSVHREAVVAHPQTFLAVFDAGPDQVEVIGGAA